MPRMRIIKPEFWDDEKLCSISRDARLTFIGLWTNSDDYGVVKGHPAWLKSQIYPYDEIKIETFQQWVQEIENLNMIIPFSANSELFYFIRNFNKHQTINRVSKIRNPIPPDSITEDSVSTHAQLTDQKRRREKGKGSKEKGKGKPVCEYPEWLNLALWEEFKKYRIEIKSKTTPHGEKLLIADLKKLIDQGETQDMVINQTIKSGKWKGFWPVKNNATQIQDTGPRYRTLEAPND